MTATCPGFGKLTQLESLSLENTPITGAGFGQLKGLDKLTALNLNKTRVGDSALRQLGKLPRLQRLELSSTRVSDGGLNHILASAGQLQYLDLFGTNITDAGLASLQNKQGMQALFLGGTQTSDARAQLPSETERPARPRPRRNANHRRRSAAPARDEARLP